MLRILNGEAWTATATSPRAAAASGRVRRGAGEGVPALPTGLLLDGVSVESVHDVLPAARVRGLADRVVDLTVDAAAGESALIAVRHPSGALTFHAPVLGSSPSRGPARGVARGAGASLRFRVQTPVAEGQSRGIVSAALKFLVVKITEPAIDAARRVAGELLAKGGERLLWKARDLSTGWHHVAVKSEGLELTRTSPGEIGGGQRSLLLLHGTFSNARGAFDALGRTRFFESVRPLYGDRIFAFNHYTISDEPEENVHDLLDALPQSGREFDVVTHSRGGLVLRHAVERRELFGAKAERFRLGRAVLVASPNAGTPLATPGRYEQTFGLLANLLEVLPDNPWTTLPELLANGIVWLASNVIPAMRGVAVMDRDSATLHALEAPPGPPLSAYSALCSSYEPTSGVLSRLLDAGIDRFFDGANDLVVPTQGGWRVDGASSAIPAQRIGCFGPGGNLRSRNDEPVSHVDFFRHDATAQFLADTLTGKQPSIELLDPDRPLPTRIARRGGLGVVGLDREPRAPRPRAHDDARHAGAFGDGDATPLAAAVFPSRFSGDDVLQLMILDDPTAGAAPDSTRARRAGQPGARILAMYNGARTLDPFATRDPETLAKDDAERDGPGSRFHRIIGLHKRIRLILTNQPDSRTKRIPPTPTREELRAVGVDLFESLFVGGVKRLYDIARSEQRERPLNLVLTSAVPWLATLPWELAFDPDRKKFLVTEEVHLVRNVLSAVPAERLTPILPHDPLRILVVVAQPFDAPALSSEDERDRIEAGFRRLIDAKLVTVDTLTDVTAGRLHRKIEAAVREHRDTRALRDGVDAEERRGYDIVHFIGHGEFDRKAAEGTLIFVNEARIKKEIRIQQLREILSGRGIRLVFLNACDTAEGSHRTLNRGVAQALVHAGIPAVMANQYPVLDPSAVAFAEHFYWALATGATLGEAARESRIALGYSVEEELIDAAVPVLYARDPSYRLCRPRPTAAAATAAPERPGAAGTPAAARGRPVERVRVGVADLTRSFIGIDALLERLNRAQQRIELKRVNLVAPYGVWNQKQRYGRAYLNAEAFLTRLQAKPDEIGVHYLVAITDQWLMDEKAGYDWYAWWSHEEALRVMVFSVAGFEIPRRGRVMEQVIGNELVSTLAAKIFDTATARDPMHAAGAKDCPFYVNDERSVAVLEHKRRFDARCRAKLLKLKKLPADLDAHALVAAFDAMLAAASAGGE